MRFATIEMKLEQKAMHQSFANKWTYTDKQCTNWENLSICKQRCCFIMRSNNDDDG